MMKSNILLLITAAIWGSAFVAQRVGMDYIGPFTYSGIRFLIGGLALIPFAIWLRHWQTSFEFDCYVCVCLCASTRQNSLQRIYDLLFVVHEPIQTL